MLLEFLGAAHEVTGSCHFLQYEGKHLLVDCGMHQGPDLYVKQEIPVNAAAIDTVVVTHAHVDHSGLLPLLYAHGFRGRIYCTQATYELCTIMLKDSAHIQEAEAEWKNRKSQRCGGPTVEPLYTIEDVQGVINLFTPCVYEELVEIDDNLKLRFVDAGHLLGSSSVEMWVKEKGKEVKIAFSGDLGQGNKPLIKQPEFIKEADYVVMESTYGDRLHGEGIDYALALSEVIKNTFIKGGNLVIPAFSVGRTQEMLYYLRKIKTEQLLPEFSDFEVYIDSPLAIEATNVFHKSVEECFSEEAKNMVEAGINPIQFPGLKTAVTADQSKMINFLKKPVVIISASGMCEAGRVRHHLKHNLWRAESTILFVGYQVPGTLGHALLNGAKDVRLFGESIDVHASIINLPGLSGHADMDKLTQWAGAFENKPKKYFIVHGDDKVTESFANHLKAELKAEAVAPFSGDIYDLFTGQCIKQGSRLMVEKTAAPSKVKASSNVFARLLAAGQRLLTVINKNEGLANKDLGKFADQINSLCDKWDR